MSWSARSLILVLLLALAALGYVAYDQWKRAEAARSELGIEASRVLSAVFTNARELRVARLSGEVITRTTHDGRIFRSEQRTRAPYSVGYFVDLEKVGQGDYAWDAARRTMTVTIPDVRVDPPAIDMARAKVAQNGMWISRSAGLALNQRAAVQLGEAAKAKAASPENMAKAQEGARRAVEAMVRQPLVAAGFRDIRVVTRFDWEPRRSAERWDVSRSVQDVVSGR